MTTLLHLTVLLAPLADPVPDDEDVVAGWGGFAVFIGLAIAVGLLGWSLVRQLRKTDRNADAGVFGPEDTAAGRAAGEGRDRADGGAASDGGSADPS